MGVFNNYAYYYDLLYKDKDYFKEAAQIDGIIKTYCVLKDGNAILNMGCGTGKHDFELNKLGYRTTGVDLSSDMIKLAKQDREGMVADKKHECEFELADIREYSPHRKYDIVTSLFHVLSYQNKNDDILRVFETANKALCSKGLFIFDCWYGPGVLTDLPSVRVKKVENEESIVIRCSSPIMYAEDNRVEVCYDMFVIDKETKISEEIKEVHSMRYFFKPEIELMLNLNGFELVACLDCRTLKFTDYTSWTAYFVAMKK